MSSSHSSSVKASAVNPTLRLVMNTKKCYLESGKYSDVTVVCGGEKFKLHRIILDSQSDVFAMLFGGPFKEGSGNQKEVELEDDDPRVFKALVYYLYYFSYDDSVRGDLPVSTFTVAVYAIADKYDIPSLREVAASKLKKCCDPNTDLEDFVDAVYAVEEHTAEPTLWNILIPKIRANITSLLKCETFQKLLGDIPSLNVKLLQQLDPTETHTFEVPEQKPTIPGPAAKLSSMTARSRPTAATVASAWGAEDEDDEDSMMDEDESSGWHTFDSHHGKGQRLGGD